MPTQVVVEARELFEGIDASPLIQMKIKHLIDLVEEYGDALLKVGRMGSESFRKGGTEVDAQACVEYALKTKRNLQETIAKMSREKKNGDDSP